MIPKAKKIFPCRLVTSAVAAVLLLAAIGCAAKDNPPSSLSDESRAPVEVTAKVDKAAADPGDIITLVIEADHLSEIAVDIPEIVDKLSDFRIVNSGHDREGKGDRLKTERWYKLQADTAGSYIIEPVEITYALPGGGTETAKTPKIYIEIASLLSRDGKAEDIRDIKPPIELPYPYRLFLLIAAAVLACILAIPLAKKLIERLRQRAEIRKLAQRPPHEEALEALERLLKKGLIEQGRTREFCFEISEIFRRYMHARLDIPAIDLTTEEIIPCIEKNGIVAGNLKPIVKDFLISTDLAKFAKFQPAKEEIDKIIDCTRIFINETTIEPETRADGDAS